MKAMVINQFGGPEQLSLQEVAMPNSKSGQVLVRVHAVGVNPVDFKIRNGSMKFITGKKFPRILGQDIAGVVEQAGKNSKFRPGDEVYGMLSYEGGGYAEFLAVKESQLAPVPDELSMAEAAAVPLGSLTAYQSFKIAGGIKTGTKVLINGASGGVGSFAVQIAKSLGANVTAVCSSRNVDFVKGLGADRVLDYTEDDFTKLEPEFDIVFDAVAKSSFRKSKKILVKDGAFISTIPNNNLFFYQFTNFLRSKKAYFSFIKPKGEDLRVISDMISNGLVNVYLEKTFPLEEAHSAHELIETERVRGKLVLEVLA
ncbi:MAG: NAD(P)-dependent alcohol dehydrogenase [Bacteroides sp.]|jgi:2-desacetyl-2-hydroxyethyl bacteriochlorophyllide A dehydrogenase|nr:NAD(P)-dependent alcohol dehydrogenase [Bacteroides sp.]